MSEKVTMDSMKLQQVEREAHRAQANRGELVERIARAVRKDGSVEPLKGLRLHRASSPTESVHGMSGPAFCVIDLLKRGQEFAPRGGEWLQVLFDVYTVPTCLK